MYIGYDRTDLKSTNQKKTSIDQRRKQHYRKSNANPSNWPSKREGDY